MATITFFHAHPDDEAIATGGTMAVLAEQGHRVVLVTATRGELGEIPEGLLDPGQTLAERRADELAAACRILGVDRQVFLDYADSGMAGEETNVAEGCFAACDVEEAATTLSRILVDEGADVFVTYDEHGGYGHPDHIQVHRVGMRAAELAGTPVVYLSTMDRDFLTTVMAQAAAAAPEASDQDGRPDDMESIGEPAARITTQVDVSGVLARKRQSMRAHTSQIGEDSFFLSMPEEQFAEVWGQEWYIQVQPAIDRLPDAARQPGLRLESGLLVGATPTVPVEGADVP
jgi:LmbE family N-acetylglucosaminyl deacetylase